MAFTYSYTSIPDTDVDPDSPLTTGLMTGIVHNLVHLREWIGGSFYAGAAPDHNHDGVNSSLIAATGASIFKAHEHEIYDHFMTSALSGDVWSAAGAIGLVTSVNAHYIVFDDSADVLTGNGIFRLELIKLILEFGAKIGTAGTSWGTNNRMGIRGSTRGADFINAGVADKVRCRTRGSGGGGTQDSDVTVPGAGVDGWHSYKIDLTSTAQTVFYIDGSAVATHSTTVPDAQDMSVSIAGDASIDMWVCYVKLYSTQDPPISSA